MPRKKPYSGKKKKLQLQEKRRRKLTNENKSDESENEEEGTKGSKSDTEEDHGEKLTVEEQPEKLTKTFNPNRFRLQFLQESNAELRRGREKGRQPLSPVPEIELEVNDDEVKDYIDIAKRPPWDYRMTTEQLESRESKYFQEYLNKIFSEHDLNELSYFELNLETWRQLWRVLEKSDILLMIVDIRYPMLHFSPALYNHIVHDIGKKAILILNKIDMVPPELVIAWKEYFLLKYPKLHVACFTSYPKEAITNQSPGKAKMKRRRGGRMTTNMGAQELLEICEDIVQNNVDLSSWRHKIESESEAADLADETFEEEDNEGETTHKQSTSVKYKNGILTIGCLGYPNVGKSSLLNGLKGVKVVSVSKTPGHTKHFQTIFLTPTVKLCDCPGLVFPSKVDKALQVLAGIYPISQVREPFSAIRYLAERTDVISMLHLHHPDNESKEWSPYDLCEALAIKKGLLTAKAGRPDIHRSANLILRMGLDGRLCLALRPPGFTKNRDGTGDVVKVNFKQINNFQPLLIASQNWSNKVLLQKTDPDAVFLVGSFSLGDESCDSSGHFRFYEGHSSSRLLRYEGTCAPSNKTWVSDRETIYLDMETPTYKVFVMAAKDHSEKGCIESQAYLQSGRWEQFITSANFPRVYPAKVDCKWSITSSRGGEIELTLYYLDTEVGPTGQCDFDSLRIHSDNGTHVLCGENDWSKRTFSGSSFTIEFKSDFSGRRNGFLIGYYEIIQPYLIKEDL